MTDSDIEKNHDWLFIGMYRTSASINEPITVSIPITEWSSPFCGVNSPLGI